MMTREGRWPVVLVLLAAAMVQIAWGIAVAWPIWLLAAGLVYLFRDPNRVVPSLPLAVVSPVDGRVTSVRRVSDPWLEREVLRVGIRLPFLGVGFLRSPTEGKVMDYKLVGDVYRSSEFCVAPRRTVVCHALWLRTDEGDDVVFVVSSRRSFHRLRRYLLVGERVGQGQRCGFVYFASRVDVLVPADSRAQVSRGQRILAGSSVVATLVHDQT